MSTDDYAQDYFSEPQDSQQQAQYQQSEYQQPSQQQQVQQPPQYVSVEQYNALQQQLQQLQSNPLQGLGYQPVPKGPEFDPERVATAKQFLQAEGVMTKADFQEFQQEMAAQEAGYHNAEHAVSAYRSFYYDAQAKNDTQKIAELNQIAQIFETNPRQAIKAFQALSQRAQNAALPQQSQTFGHVPSQQQAQSKPRFNSMEEFNAFRTSNPAEGEQLMRDWIEKKISPIPEFTR